MPATLFVALEREIPGFTPHVRGVVLAENPLDELAEELNVQALADFFRLDPNDVFDDEDLDATGDNGFSDLTATDWWFDAREGLATVQALLEHHYPTVSLDKVLPKQLQEIDDHD